MNKQLYGEIKARKYALLLEVHDPNWCFPWVFLISSPEHAQHKVRNKKRWGYRIDYRLVKEVSE